MVGLVEIGIVLQTIGVLSAATAAVIGVRSYINSNKRAEEAKKKEQETRERELSTRQAQMFMNIYNQLITKEFTKALHTFYSHKWSNWAEYQETLKDPDFQEAQGIIGTYYEGLGVLVREGYLDIRLIALLICGQTLLVWGKFKPIINEAREELGFSRFMSESEYLYDELLNYLKLHPELSTEVKRPWFSK